MESEKLWLKLRSSFWFLPAIYGLIAIGLVFAVHNLDSWLIHHHKMQLPQVLLTSSDVAKELYSALVTAILTMTTISISVIMAVLTTYSSQFSPRTLQDFMRSSSTHHVLGFYSFGFIFALLHLILVDKNSLVIGPIFMGLIAIMILGFFIYFIHYSARWVQVNHLIAKIRIDGSRVIHNTYKSREYLAYSNWNEEEVNEIKRKCTTLIHAKNPGYIQTIDFKNLVAWSRQHNAALILNVQVGDYVLEDYPLLHITVSEDQKYSKELHEYIIIDSERTDILDIEFSLQKLVDIALRAISPAINDPHTAINCINRIGELLHETGKNYRETCYLADKEKQLRVIHHPKKFEDYLYKSFYQIRHYGRDDISIIYGIMEVLYKLSVVSNNSIKQKLWKFHYYITDVIEWDFLSELDRQHMQSICDAFKACHQNGYSPSPS